MLLVCRCMRALSLICVDASRLAVGREVPPEGVRLAPFGIGRSSRAGDCPPFALAAPSGIEPLGVVPIWALDFPPPCVWLPPLGIGLSPLGCVIIRLLALGVPRVCDCPLRALGFPPSCVRLAVGRHRTGLCAAGVGGCLRSLPGHLWWRLPPGVRVTSGLGDRFMAWAPPFFRAVFLGIGHSSLGPVFMLDFGAHFRAFGERIFGCIFGGHFRAFFDPIFGVFFGAHFGAFFDPIFGGHFRAFFGGIFGLLWG